MVQIYQIILNNPNCCEFFDAENFKSSKKLWKEGEICVSLQRSKLIADTQNTKLFTHENTSFSFRSCSRGAV